MQVLLEQLRSMDSVSEADRLQVLCCCDSDAPNPVHVRDRHEGSEQKGPLKLEVMLGDLAFDLQDCRQDVALTYRLQTTAAV